MWDNRYLQRVGTLVSSVTHFGKKLLVDVRVRVRVCVCVGGSHVIIIVRTHRCLCVCVCVVGDNNIGHE